ncbi:PREDICTED: DEP domain-containing mTOR-interacting protein-like [Galeopterus variegatus]|uniref:DEP domain-containing mTOR-interacting protein-like n=1 Tax=Galeopterus variegatus TaxID=482537 RepID=A0ABM0RHK7_GALVR|nr:PREDICTED: DEP domain-containing mTOR-interacting protein-like [Galeopterus variegatus]
MEEGGSAGSDSSTGGSGGAQQRELERMAEVLVTGEQLRLRLCLEQCLVYRKHHLKIYPRCTVAKHLLFWLLELRHSGDRETAIKLMQKLADRGIIHHVCDEHKEFKDVKLFYRFRKDDGTFPLDNEVKAFMRGQRLYEKLMSPENTLLQPREEEGVKYERTFMASEFLDWLVQEGEATTRKEAEQLCHRLMEHSIIQHGFRVTVLKRPVTSEELLTPGAPYARKTFTIVGDAVGWGFVVRGSKPCHIQAVDPSGPAAAAGMKVCQFVVSVNGLNVLHVDYRTVSNLILTGPRTIVMEVMEELEC